MTTVYILFALLGWLALIVIAAHFSRLAGEPPPSNARRYADMLCAYNQAIRERRASEWYAAHFAELSRLRRELTPDELAEVAHLMEARETTPL